MQILLKCGARLDTSDYQGRTALHCATHAEDTHVLHMLLKSGSAKIDCVDDDKMTPLMLSAIECHVEHIQLLIQNGADISLSDIDGRTALHWCYANKNVQCVKLLLFKNSDLLKVKDLSGRTVLHRSAAEGSFSLCYYLLTLDESIGNDQDEMKRTPVHYGAIYGHATTLKILTEFSSQLNTPDKNGATPLHFSAQQNFVECVNILLRKGALPNI